jgi:hypothetical protein
MAHPVIRGLTRKFIQCTCHLQDLELIHPQTLLLASLRRREDSPIGARLPARSHHLCRTLLPPTLPMHTITAYPRAMLSGRITCLTRMHIATILHLIRSTGTLSTMIATRLKIQVNFTHLKLLLYALLFFLSRTAVHDTWYAC